MDGLREFAQGLDELLLSEDHDAFFHFQMVTVS